jgi:Undecaprenyl-phosphate galactose phosphotransferase WbaP
MDLDVSLNYGMTNAGTAAVHHRSTGNVFWLIGADLLAITCAGLLAISWFAAGPDRALSIELTGWNHSFFYGSAALMLGYYSAIGRYTSRATSKAEMRSVFAGAVAAFCFCLALSLPSARFTARFVWESVVLWFSVAVFLCVVRETVRSILLGLGRWRLRTLVVGPEALRGPVSEVLAADRALGVELLQWVVPAAGEGLAGRRSIREHLRKADVDFVLLAGSDAVQVQKGMLRDLIQFRMPFGIIQPAGSPRRFSGRRYGLAHGLSLALSLTRLDQSVRLRIKRVGEILLASALLVLLLPLFLIFALIIRIDGGPTLYGQVRVGRGGRPFRCFKFRSMVHHADKVLADLLARDPAAAREWERDFKLKNDPRITKLGHFLRSSSLDELPQLLNVLRGEMSFVGPRPIVEAEVERYQEDIDLYYLVRPGITGLWQVSGRNDVSYDERVALDARYVLNWSLKFDLLIMLRTLPAVMRKSGAY